MRNATARPVPEGRKNSQARHRIGGERLGSQSSRDSFDPATGTVIGAYAAGGEDEANRAIAAALGAFRASPWRGDRRPRAEAIDEMADRFEAASDDPVEILGLENGRIKPEARFEVGMAPGTAASRGTEPHRNRENRP